jgi:hypothetical protein
MCLSAFSLYLYLSCLSTASANHIAFRLLFFHLLSALYLAAFDIRDLSIYTPISIYFNPIKIVCHTFAFMNSTLSPPVLNRFLSVILSIYWPSVFEVMCLRLWWLPVDGAGNLGFCFTALLCLRLGCCGFVDGQLMARGTWDYVSLPSCVWG